MSEHVEQSEMAETVEQPEVAEDETPATSEQVVDSAFIVFRDASGRWIATSDFDTEFSVLREAGADDFYVGCQSVIRDVMATETAQRVMMMQQQMAMAAARQMEAAKAVQSLGDLKGGVDLAQLNRQARRHPA